jgi:group I intron endonuclease
MKEKTFIGLSRSGIYKMTLPNGKIYVGQAKNIKKRIQSYKYLKCVGQPAIFKSISENGFEAHKFEVLEFCEPDKLLEREVYYIALLQTNVKRFPNGNGLNFTDGGLGSNGFYHDEATRAKMSKIQSGRTNSIESNLKRSITQKGRPPYPNTLIAVKGKKKSKEHVAKIVSAHLMPVIDTASGTTYTSIKEASEKTGINKATLAGWLRGDYENKSTLRYLTKV